jgi:beta-glucosidase
MKSSKAPQQGRFPDGFLWGAATSAYQVEGSPLADGAGPSIWHRFVRTPGLVRNGDTGDVACDHYRRFKSDVALMKRLGLTAYRFSISWSRVLPAGVGRVNPAGLDFYERLVDELLRAGIEPMVTLYHWDLPAALDDRGGWLNPDAADWFVEYAQTLYRRLDDRVRLWATLNEPWVVTDGGYLHGALAPGHRNFFETPIASHNLLRAHGAAVREYRAGGRHQVGIVVNIEPKYPASDAPEDIAATRRAHAYMNEQYLDPVFLGRYPEEMQQIFGEAWPAWPASDFELIRQPLDFVGVNYYTRSVTRFDPDAWPLRASRVRQNGAVYTETDWEVYPKGLTDTLTWVRDRYGPIPQYVTENGASFADPATAGAEPLDDPARAQYFHEHLRATYAAIEQGVDVRGYFAWSLFDNLEWSLGFSKRFGIVHVDFKTLKRTLKSSGLSYSKVIQSHGAALNEPA